MYSIRISTHHLNDPILIASNIKTTKEAGEMIDHFLHEGFSAMGIEPEDIISASVVKETDQRDRFSAWVKRSRSSRPADGNTEI